VDLSIALHVTGAGNDAPVPWAGVARAGTPDNVGLRADVGGTAEADNSWCNASRSQMMVSSSASLSDGSRGVAYGTLGWGIRGGGSDDSRGRAGGAGVTPADVASCGDGALAGAGLGRREERRRGGSDHQVQRGRNRSGI